MKIESDSYENLVLATSGAAGSPKRRLRLLATVFAAGIAAASGVAYAVDAGGHRGAAMHGAGYEQIDLAHLQVLVHHLMTKATPEQKEKIIAIAQSSESELTSVSEQALAARYRKVDLLLQDGVDRAAFERAQASELQASNQLSKGIDQVLSDLAEVMTPEQRAQLREHVKAYRG